MAREADESTIIEDSGATVHYSLALKIQLGNFQSVSPHIGVTLPVRDGETIAVAYRRAKEFVEERMEKERVRWTKERKD